MMVDNTGNADHRCRSARRTLGRIMDVLGNPIDERGPVEPDADRARSTARRRPTTSCRPSQDLLETGIKVIDLICPFAKGGKVGLFGGAGVGKTVNMMELINNIAKAHCGPVGVRRRRRAHPRRQRLLSRDGRLGRRQPREPARVEGGDGLRPDERAAGQPPARRADRPDHRRVRSATKAATCCSSSTTSTATRWPAPKCRRCSAACLRRWATSRRWPRKWAACRSASPRPRSARSPRSRPCTCPPTT